jgi:hypothetical protein
MSTFLSNTDRFNSLITDVPVIESPAEAADHRGWMAEYRAHMVRKQAQATEDPEHKKREIVASFCSFQIARYRNLAAEERARAAKNPDQAAEEYAQMAEEEYTKIDKEEMAKKYDEAVKDWFDSFAKDPLEALGTEYVDVIGEYMSEAFVYQADAAEYRAQMITKFGQAMKDLNNGCDLLTEEQNPAEHRALAFKIRAATVTHKTQAIQMLLQATQNLAMAFESQVWLQVWLVEYQVWMFEYLTAANDSVLIVGEHAQATENFIPALVAAGRICGIC